MRVSVHRKDAIVNVLLLCPDGFVLVAHQILLQYAPLFAEMAFWWILKLVMTQLKITKAAILHALESYLAGIVKGDFKFTNDLPVNLP